MSRHTARERKELLFTRTMHLFQFYHQFIIINLTNITSLQLQTVKQHWHGQAEFLFGKNTTINKALRAIGRDDIAARVAGNVAFVFTNGDVRAIKQIVDAHERHTYAKVGAIAQSDVWIEKKVTNMGPDKTSFFQALGISTKITKGKVEITQNSKALTAGEKVTPSQANLLAIMDIQPFVYAIRMECVYGDRQFYEPWIVDVKEEDVRESMVGAVRAAAALALATGTRARVTVPFDLRNALRQVVAVSLATGYSVDLAEMFK